MCRGLHLAGGGGRLLLFRLALLVGGGLRERLLHHASRGPLACLLGRSLRGPLLLRGELLSGLLALLGLGLCSLRLSLFLPAGELLLLLRSLSIRLLLLLLLSSLLHFLLQLFLLLSAAFHSPSRIDDAEWAVGLRGRDWNHLHSMPGVLFRAPL